LSAPIPRSESSALAAWVRHAYRDQVGGTLKEPEAGGEHHSGLDIPNPQEGRRRKCWPLEADRKGDGRTRRRIPGGQSHHDRFTWRSAEGLSIRSRRPRRDPVAEEGDQSPGERPGRRLHDPRWREHGGMSSTEPKQASGIDRDSTLLVRNQCAVAGPVLVKILREEVRLEKGAQITHGGLPPRATLRSRSWRVPPGAGPPRAEM